MPGTTIYYAAFAHDECLNFASGVCMPATVPSPGDFDRDGDVDVTDFAFFQTCLSGDAIPRTAECFGADLDADVDVDAADFTQFDGCMRGANRTPGC